MSENQPVWQTDGQEFKEATFIQTGRRGGDVEMHGVAWSGAETQNELSHIHVWCIKIGKGASGVRDPSPTAGHVAQGSSARKLSPNNFGWKNQWGLGSKRNCRTHRRLLLKGLQWT